METLELLIYISVAIVAGFLMLSALRNVDYIGLYERLVKKTGPEEETQVKVTKDTLAERLMWSWQECAYGEVAGEYAAYIEGSGTLTREQVLWSIRRINMCDKIGCDNGTTRLVFPESIDLPKVINIKCSDNNLIVT